MSIPAEAAPHRAHVGWIESAQVEPSGDMTVVLREGPACLVEHDSDWFDLWSRLVEASLEFEWPVYVTRETASGRVRLMLPADVHQVREVRPDTQDAGRLRILLSGSHAVHFLETAGEGGARRAARLQEAAATGRRVVITEDPLGGEIIDVRFAPGTTTPAES